MPRVIRDNRDLPAGWPRPPGYQPPNPDVWPALPKIPWIPPHHKEERRDDRPTLRIEVPPIKLDEPKKT